VSFWDNGANKIYLARRSERAQARGLGRHRGVTGGSGVELRNPVVEQFGVAVQSRAVSASDWLIVGVGLS
jgi:hypothetical protein